MNFNYNQDFRDFSLPWAGHKYFVYDLVKSFQPEKIVELGTFKGTSMFAMLQAIKDHNLQSEFNAIDSWEGDRHAGYYEGEKWLEDIKLSLSKYYNEQNVKLHRTYFDSALEHFEENSIDLLHIDGLHTYEAVKHDFDSWLPKVKGNGIILFHDIVITREDFGVWKLWEELKQSEDYHTIEFHHSCGLGVLTRSIKTKEILESLIKNEAKYITMAYEDAKVYAEKLELEKSYLDRELQFIHNSKYWKFKSKIKRLLGKK